MAEEQKGNWVKLFRSFLNWEWYTDTNTKVVFIHCLLKANWTAGRFQGIEVPAGSFVTSLSHLADETGLSIKNVRTALDHLKETNEIGTLTHRRYTLITVNNWDVYQDEVARKWQANGTQVAGKRQQYKKERIKEGNISQTSYDQRTIDYAELQRRLVNK